MSFAIIVQICVCVGAQLHHMTQVGLSGRVNEGRQPGALNWGPYHEEDFRPVNRDPVSVTFPYYIHFLSFFFFCSPCFLILPGKLLSC